MPKRKNSEQTASTLDELMEKYKGSLEKGGSETFSYNRIPFNIPALDRLVGGGIPKKRITLLAGQPNTGKSYLASQIVSAAQKNGGKAIWIDAEASWDPSWMEKCGVDPDNVLVAQPVSGEDAFTLVRETMEDGVDVVVLDSIAGLVPAAMNEQDFDYNPIAWQARMVNQALPRLIPALKHGTAFVIINQTRQGMGKVSFETMPGGIGQSFFAHFILEVRRSGWLEEKGERVGFDVEVRCRKTKVGGEPFQSCTVPFSLGGGVDIIESMIREGIAAGLIKQAGPWYNILENDTKVMGMNGVRQYFTDNPEELEKLTYGIVG